MTERQLAQLLARWLVDSAGLEVRNDSGDVIFDLDEEGIYRLFNVDRLACDLAVELETVAP
jgi:hypothetical protein